MTAVLAVASAAAPSVALAQELLRRTGCARPGLPWVVGTDAGPVVDLVLLRCGVHLLDLSEEAVARIALSIATGRPVDLRSAFAHLTRDHAEAVMIAVASAGGHDRVESRIVLVDGERRVESVPPLGVWPDRGGRAGRDTRASRSF
ncbi:hypothetical protein HRK28_03975 [Rathayibacter sp. VKM Ac-2835]|uniref:hypothetical protein n=1 Tax=Rathayibacter sp. VKM Ac-2835 TaxID=2739043 RepID=UPI001563746D|nr:hypothetical protein [Rathayibacter sp. VKM Ac-2835]NRG40073.1 hypothetical protein [Rathayibacter sp. VKM Ac-2835]